MEKNCNSPFGNTCNDPLNMHGVHKARGMKNGLAYHFVISNGQGRLMIVKFM